MEVFLFIIGYYVHFCASCLLMYKIATHKSIYGLSVDTQIGYLMAVVCRCIWVMETRLVETVFAYLELLVSTGVAFVLCYFCWKYHHTTTKHSVSYLRIYVTAPLAMVLAFLFHPGQDWVSMQILVAFSMYMEAIAMLPQLWLMRKMHEVEPLTSHYVGLLVIARMIRMVFWVKLFILGEHFVELLIADMCHALFSADYLWLWLRKLRTGGRLVLSVHTV